MAAKKTLKRIVQTTKLPRKNSPKTSRNNKFGTQAQFKLRVTREQQHKKVATCVGVNKLAA